MRSTYLVAIAVAALLVTHSARADLIVNVPFSLMSLQNGPVLGTVAIPQFDPAQGTLNSVTLTVSPTFQFILDVFDTGPGAVTATVQDTLSFAGTPLAVQGAFSGTIPANQTVFTLTPSPVSSSPLTELFGQNAVGIFVGANSVPFDLSLAPATVVQFAGPTTTNVIAFSLVSGTVTADFAFAPVPATVPEPADFLPAGLAMFAMAAIAGMKTKCGRPAWLLNVRKED